MRRSLLYLAGALAAAVIVVAGFRVWRERNHREARRHNRIGVALMDDSFAGSRDRLAIEEEFWKALRLWPGYSAARTNLALMRSGLGYAANSSPLAHQDLKSLLEDEPGNLHARYALGRVLSHEGRPSEALSQFRAVLEADPSDVYTRYHLACALLDSGSPKEAIDVFLQVLEAWPECLACYWRLRIAYKSLGQEREMAAAAESFLSRQTPPTEYSYHNFRRPAEDRGSTIIRDKYLQPIIDPGVRLEDPEPKPRYLDVTRRAGISPDPTAKPASDETLRALRGEPTSSAWFASAANRDALASAMASGCALADFDGDGWLDVFVAGLDGKHALYLQRKGGVFEDATAASGVQGAPALPMSCACGDADFDGVTDIFLAGFGAARLLRNLGGGRFSDDTQASRIAASIPAATWLSGAVFGDADHDGDLDLYVCAVADVASSPTAPVAVFPTDFPAQKDLLLRNNGDGSFTEITDTALRGTGRAAEAPGKSRAAFFTDADGDRASDIVTLDFSWRPTVHRNRRDFTFETVEPSRDWALEFPPAPPPGQSQARGDYDQDGAVDLLVNDPSVGARLLRNEVLPENWLTVRLAGRRSRLHSDSMGVGGIVTVHGEGLWRRREVLCGHGLLGGDAPEVTVDVGDKLTIDAIRAVFPSGGRKSEKDVRSNQVITIPEPNLDPNSCPAVFAWDGARFTFITDTISAGILGELVAPGGYWKPDPDEWLRIDGGLLAPRDGRLELRFANALEEVVYLDQCRLVAVDCPADLDAEPGERMLGEPAHRAPAKLFALRDARPIARATDHRGNDVTSRLASVDRVYADSFALLTWKGFAEDWSLALDLGPGRPDVLLLDGWTSWNSSAAAVAASQAGKTLWGPSLDAQAPSGDWRVAEADLGVPAGLPRTMLVDVRGILREGEHVVRIRSNRTVYFDRARVAQVAATADPASPSVGPSLRVSEAPVVAAELHWLGYPRRVLPDGREPEVMDYTVIEPEAEWRTHAGLLTRFGDVAPLVSAVDGRFVVMEHGEEVALSFDAGALPALAEDWKRTYLLYSNGYEKGAEMYSAAGDTVEPLPFPGMPSYPYPAAAEPLDDSRVGYELEWNTRERAWRGPR